jgi:death-on-curing family protein
MSTYLEKEQLPPLFAYLAERYAKLEEVPSYSDERIGYGKILGVLEGVRMDVYYPDVLDKAAYLLIQINKGHFFSNGNKRLALVVATVFLDINGKHLKDLPKEEYRTLLTRLFPEYKDWSDFPDFSSTDFATYHLSIIIADSGTLGIAHDDLKTRVKAFFTEATE